MLLPARAYARPPTRVWGRVYAHHEVCFLLCQLCQLCQMWGFPMTCKGLCWHNGVTFVAQTCAKKLVFAFGLLCDSGSGVAEALKGDGVKVTVITGINWLIPQSCS